MTRRQALPPEVYALVEQTPAAVLLEGGNPHNPDTNQEPWTQLFTAPLCVCMARTPAEVPALFAALESAVAAGHCAAGYLRYECGQSFEPHAGLRPGPPGQPLAWFGIYARGYVFNHATGEFAGGEPPELARFRGAGPLSEPEIDAEFALGEAEYAQRIAAIHDWIRAGDVYQLNFTAPWRVRTRGGAAAVYAHLRARQPVEYGAFLHERPGRHILSFSPELFFRMDCDGAARRITTRPMKGTAPRGRTTREDRQIAEWLRNDPKNRAENVMIVDLLRNDLGRLARFGTVRAERLFEVERYSTLWQMTSTVSGELRPEAGLHDIFRALFPCGSVTGAPKVRAMQLLAGLEEEPRGVYTGAIGFFSPQQTVFNVAIRTLELEGGAGRMGAGSGIVIDSDAAQEYRECLLKAQFLTGRKGNAAQRPALPLSAGQFSLIETMLWDKGYPLLELHLDRLADSAAYFGFAGERAAAQAALEAYARGFADTAPRKVRLLLDAAGGVQITDEVLAAPGGEQAVGRVRLWPERTDSADPMYFHKTTHRPLYARAFAEGARDGFADVLFLNQRGEVTEGAISNVFVVQDGRWLTPPVECGLLAGVYRRHLLETRPEIEERVLSERDLRRADAVYLCNAVRGLRQVVLED